MAMSKGHLYRGGDFVRLAPISALSTADLWVAGDAGALGASEAVALVGSRAATRRGLTLAGELAAALVGRGALVVSGGALGVDAAAHEAALRAGGRTVAVLGTGVDVVYPRRHGELFRRIAATGALVSALPPGTEPKPGQFPARNKFIAGLADGVVIVEAGRDSGSLYTAEAALRYGRPVWAVPGSPGADDLLAGGRAIAIRSGADLLAVLDGDDAAQPAPPNGGDEARVWAWLKEVPSDAAVLARSAGLPIAASLAALMELELSGLAVRASGGRWRRLPQPMTGRP
jgi:DNA processing protein